MDPLSLVESLSIELGIKPPPIYVDPKLPVPGRWMASLDTGSSAIYINPSKVSGIPIEFVVAHELFHEYAFRKGLKFSSIVAEERAANEFAQHVTGYHWMNYTHLERLKPILTGAIIGVAASLGVAILGRKK